MMSLQNLFWDLKFQQVSNTVVSLGIKLCKVHIRLNCKYFLVIKLWTKDLFPVQNN